MESNDALAYRLDAYKKIVQFVRDGVAHECIADVHEVAVLLPTIYPVLLKDTKSQDPALAIYAHRILGFCCLHPAFRQLAPVPLVLTTWCEGLVKKDTDKDGILLAVLWSVQNHNLPLAASDNQRLQDAVSSLLTAPSAVFSTSLKVCAVAALNKLIQQSRPSDSADCKWIPDVVSFLFATDPKLRDASCDLLDLVPSTVQYSQNVLRVLSAKASMSLEALTAELGESSGAFWARALGHCTRFVGPALSQERVVLPAILRRYNALFSSHTPATLIAALQSWCTLLTECFAPASGAFFTVKNVAAMVTPLDKVFRKGTAVECRVEAVRTTSVAISVLQTHSSVASLVRNIICHACRDEHSEVRQSALDCVLALLNRLQVSDESTSHPVTVTDPVQLVAEITQCLCIQVSAAASAAIQPNADVPLLCSVLNQVELAWSLLCRFASAHRRADMFQLCFVELCAATVRLSFTVLSVMRKGAAFASLWTIWLGFLRNLMDLCNAPVEGRVSALRSALSREIQVRSDQALKESFTQAVLGFLDDSTEMIFSHAVGLLVARMMIWVVRESVSAVAVDEFPWESWRAQLAKCVLLQSASRSAVMQFLLSHMHVPAASTHIARMMDSVWTVAAGFLLTWQFDTCSQSEMNSCATILVWRMRTRDGAATPPEEQAAAQNLFRQLMRNLTAVNQGYQLLLSQIAVQSLSELQSLPYVAIASAFALSHLNITLLQGKLEAIARDDLVSLENDIIKSSSAIANVSTAFCASPVSPAVVLSAAALRMGISATTTEGEANGYAIMLDELSAFIKMLRDRTSGSKVSNSAALISLTAFRMWGPSLQAASKSAHATAQSASRILEQLLFCVAACAHEVLMASDLDLFCLEACSSSDGPCAMRGLVILLQTHSVGPIQIAAQAVAGELSRSRNVSAADNAAFAAFVPPPQQSASLVSPVPQPVVSVLSSKSSNGSASTPSATRSMRTPNSTTKKRLRLEDDDSVVYVCAPIPVLPAAATADTPVLSQQRGPRRRERSVAFYTSLDQSQLSADSLPDGQTSASPRTEAAASTAVVMVAETQLDEDMILAQAAGGVANMITSPDPVAAVVDHSPSTAVLNEAVLHDDECSPNKRPRRAAETVDSQAVVSSKDPIQLDSDHGQTQASSSIPAISDVPSAGPQPAPSNDFGGEQCASIFQDDRLHVESNSATASSSGLASSVMLTCSDSASQMVYAATACDSTPLSEFRPQLADATIQKLARGQVFTVGDLSRLSASIAERLFPQPALNTIRQFLADWHTSAVSSHSTAVGIKTESDHVMTVADAAQPSTAVATMSTQSYSGSRSTQRGISESCVHMIAPASLVANLRAVFEMHPPTSLSSVDALQAVRLLNAYQTQLLDVIQRMQE